MGIENTDNLKPEPKAVVVKDDSRPLFRIVIEYQPDVDAMDADMEFYMAAVMNAVKSIEAPNVNLVNATIERQD